MGLNESVQRGIVKKTTLKMLDTGKDVRGRGGHDLKAMSPYLETIVTNMMLSFDLRSYQCLFWILYRPSH